MATEMHPKTVTQTDWERLRTQNDADIADAVANDPDAAPIFSADDMKWFKPTPARNQR